MRILGLGIDIVEIERIESLLARHGERFLTRVFTSGEVAHSAGARARAQHLAARFACKEAVFKALGTGLAGGVTWQDVEVSSLPSGKPRIELYGGARELAIVRGAGAWEVSLTHSRSNAVAVAIAMGA
jgi:holo-[acyl-carrier protein] synthase